MSDSTSAQGYTVDTARQKFTGYEHDAETGLDYAQARYHAPAQGRFTSPDPLAASAQLTDPQSFNRYSYVGNKPTVFSDPTGMAGMHAPMRGASSMLWRDPFANSPRYWEEDEARYVQMVQDAFNGIAQGDPLSGAVSKGDSAVGGAAGKAAPRGTLTVTDNIHEHRAIDIDGQCGSNTAGGCTRAWAIPQSIPTNDGTTWRARNVDLRLYGDMWITRGRFPYKGRSPVDRSVVDADTARDHEYNAHINVARDAVTPLINEFLGRTFRSQQEFTTAANQLSVRVSELFRRTLRETQDREN